MKGVSLNAAIYQQNLFTHGVLTNVELPQSKYLCFDLDCQIKY